MEAHDCVRSTPAMPIAGNTGDGMTIRRPLLCIAFRRAIMALAVLAGVVPRDGGAESAVSTWTKGHRKVLVIPVRFTDRSGPTNFDANGYTGWDNFTNGTTQTEINGFFLKQSYNQFSIDFTILPEVDLGVPTGYYTNVYPGAPAWITKWVEWGAPGSLVDDARAKARAVGLTNGMAAKYESSNYDLDIVAGGYNSYMGGAASDGGRAVLAFNFNALPHELCHCLGLQHANGISRPTGYSPVKAGSFFTDPYGDLYCLMGYKMNSRTARPSPNRDANPYFKYQLGWLTASNILTPATSGTYRIYAFDQGSVEAGKDYAMRIARDTSRTYWFDLRQAITNPPDSKWSQSGLEVRFGAESTRASSGMTVLWDMTPGSRGYTGTNFASPGPNFATMHDAPLQLGRTCTDAGADLHVTPVRKGGTTPESLDVVVNFGPFLPTNKAPAVSISPTNVSIGANVVQSFTATASDPDGDLLAYYWEFDDNTVDGGTDFGGLNADARLSTNGVHSWSQMGVNFVRCTVTDMKGGTMTVSAAVTVTNGSPAPVTISGVIKDELGNPLSGAIVNNYRSGIDYGATNFAGSSETASDGKYRIAVPFNSYTYRLAPMWQGYSFTNAIGGTISTVTVASANIGNVNFSRTRLTRTISGGVYKAGGWGYDSSTDGDLWVSNGIGQSVVVSNGGWQMSVSDGALVMLTATTTNQGYVVSSDFPKPYRVVDDVLTLSFFVDVPGALPQTGFTSSGTNSDDTVGTVNAHVIMTLPAGRTNWVQDQYFYCSIDESSTARYGVDYRACREQFAFYANKTPSPFPIPLTVIHDSVPKRKTVVFKLTSGSSIANLGPVSTYTYTIINPVPSVSAVLQSDHSLYLSWESKPSVPYSIEHTPTMVPAAWSNLPPYTNLQGSAGAITQLIDLGTMPQGMFRVKVE